RGLPVLLVLRDAGRDDGQRGDEEGEVDRFHDGYSGTGLYLRGPPRPRVLDAAQRRGRWFRGSILSLCRPRATPFAAAPLDSRSSTRREWNLRRLPRPPVAERSTGTRFAPPAVRASPEPRSGSPAHGPDPFAETDPRVAVTHSGVPLRRRPGGAAVAVVGPHRGRGRLLGPVDAGARRPPPAR